MVLYHGSRMVVEKPERRLGKPSNDYGRGFYCTEDEALAAEWACKEACDGFVNKYEMDMDGLRVLDLTDSEHTVLNWIAVLLANRTFRLTSEIAVDARRYIVSAYGIDTSLYDFVVGYRADDSYFQYAQAFVENSLSLRGLNRALLLGDLGIQKVLISDSAFSRIRFESALLVSCADYYPKFVSRDQKARNDYSSLKTKSYRDDIFVMDILREEMKNDDPRIRRCLLK